MKTMAKVTAMLVKLVLLVVAAIAEVHWLAEEVEALRKEATE